MAAVRAISELRPYQKEVAVAILDSVFGKKGLTFSVEIARQGGKNELSAQLEVLLLTIFMAQPGNIVKCAPTFRPQALISMMRLKDRPNDAGFDGIWQAELGYIVRLGNARAIFLSADGSANVVGNTAHILLEVDEAQDVSREKYAKEFRPMGASTNVTTVLYGTTWDDTTLLEEVKQTNLELERRDGIRRHFRYDWEEIARYSPDYGTYVLAERERLGENHPLFMTQYRLLPVHGGGNFLSVLQRQQLCGEHSRRHSGSPGAVYVAGIDLAGEEEDAGRSSGRDATVVTVGELTFPGEEPPLREPTIKIVEHYCWVGKKHPELYGQLVDIIRNIWQCRRVVVDATGIGEPVASFLKKALGGRVVPFHFTAQSKSTLGFNLLAAINSGRLKMYRPDGSEEYRDFFRQMELAKAVYRPSQTMNFYVEPSQGHDDFLMSLALLVQAAALYEPRQAKGTA
ncbi:MAG: hypothetical protein N2506_04005 [Dehalococcoidales bacterium]|nr:hypothetical protein [Dehalococcoidales bacterium]